MKKVFFLWRGEELTTTNGLVFQEIRDELKMAGTETCGDESLYPIAVLIDELRNEDVQVTFS